jgi:hypothetical protein
MRPRTLLVTLLAAICVVAAPAATADPQLVLTVPQDITTTATGPDGASVSYEATGSEGDAAVAVACDGPGGGQAVGTLDVTGTFPVGQTTVNCSATDPDNNTVNGSFTVTVTAPPPGDTTPPVISPVSDVTAEATSAQGAAVSYTAPTATDDVDGPVPVNCSPASGSTFALGSTTVTCTAQDSAGNSSQATFDVKVVDTTPPTLNVPPDLTVTATSSAGVAATNAAIAQFLSGATAQDLVDPSPAITTNAPATFPVGTTTVTFTARDASGNSTSKDAHVTVKPPAPGPPPPPPPPKPRPDTTPPANVGNLVARAGNRRVKLTWTLPGDSDFDHVVVTRSQVSAGAAAQPVYRGKATSYVDRKVTNGVQYRYVVSSVDRSGNASAGAAATATPKRVLLMRPTAGAAVRPPVVMAWIATHGASFYNVQLFRKSGKKILTAWPKRSRFVLTRTWKFHGKQRLTRGTYVWYVWPGFGSARKPRYGAMLGQSTFVVR